MKKVEISVPPINRWFLVCGALLAGFSVVLGAFGAHGLKQVLSPNSLITFEIAVRYQMYHGLALLLLPVLSAYVTGKWLNRVAICFIIGCVLFSGSLYALAVTGIKWFGPITPIGGMFFIIGWGLLVVGLIKARTSIGDKGENDVKS